MSKDWKVLYNEKLKTAEEAVMIVEPGEKVFLGAYSGIARILADALYERKDSLIAVELITVLAGRPLAAYADEGYSPFSIRTPMPGIYEREAAKKGMTLYYTPVRSWEMGQWIRSCAKPDVAFIETSRPNSAGFVSLGPAGCDLSSASIETAGKVVFQVNSNIPFLYGTKNLVSIEKADMIVEADDPIPAYEPYAVTETDQKIAENIAAVIQDGATIRLGMGPVYDALAEKLSDKKDLGIHTDILSPSLTALIEKGAVTNNLKGFAQGRTLYSRAIGDEAFYQFIHNNKTIYCGGEEMVINPKYIMSNKKMTSVLDGMVFDLFGCAGRIDHSELTYEMADTLREFEMGANWSEGGMVIFAAPSTYMDQGIRKSTITFKLPEKLNRIIPAVDVMYVATEYGCKDLRNMSMDDRVRSMISLAHPDFRRELLTIAKNNKLI